MAFSMNMKEARYFYVPDARTASELPPEEATHALRVLRLKPGDEMFLMDGVGGIYRANVTMTDKHCWYEIVEEWQKDKDWSSYIHLAIAPTKMMERMEWLAEKATEIGFDEMSFLNCKFSERKTLRVDRVEKIVVSAMKQSRKPQKPVVNGLCAFDDFIKSHTEGHRYIAHCYDEVERKDFFDELSALTDEEPVTVLVGPEGDFSIDEVRRAVDAGYVSISLGRSRLRTETAGLSAVMMARLVKRIE